MNRVRTVVLLAAGYGTRLYPLTKDRPKALLPLGQRVVLDALLESLASVPSVAGRLLVSNHTFAEQFRQWQRTRHADVRILDDGATSPETRLGAIRDLELAVTQGAATGDLLVLGTDNLFGWPLARFVDRAERFHPAPSVALWQAPSSEAATQFGVVTLDHTDRITTFVEKSPTPPSAVVALCVYYFPEPMLGAIRTFLGEGGNPDAPGYFIQWLVERGPVYGVTMAGSWYDIGTPESYHAMVNAWRS